MSVINKIDKYLVEKQSDDIKSKLLKQAEKLDKKDKKKFMDLMAKNDQAGAMELLRKGKPMKASDGKKHIDRFLGK